MQDITHLLLKDLIEQGVILKRDFHNFSICYDEEKKTYFHENYHLTLFRKKRFSKKEYN